MGIKRYELSEVQWDTYIYGQTTQVIQVIVLPLWLMPFCVVFCGGRLACLSYPTLHVLLSLQMPRRP